MRGLQESTIVVDRTRIGAPAARGRPEDDGHLLGVRKRAPTATTA
jgi:hypothetical protein